MTVINRWNNLPRDVVDSLSFKCFTSTLDTFQSDKPVSNRCRKYWMRFCLRSARSQSGCLSELLNIVPRHNSATSALLFQDQSSHNNHIYPLCTVHFRLNKNAVSKIHLPAWQVKWEPSQGRYGHLHGTSHATLIVWHNHCWRLKYTKTTSKYTA